MRRHQLACRLALYRFGPRVILSRTKTPEERAFMSMFGWLTSSDKIARQNERLIGLRTVGNQLMAAQIRQAAEIEARRILENWWTRGESLYCNCTMQDKAKDRNSIGHIDLQAGHRNGKNPSRLTPSGPAAFTHLSGRSRSSFVMPS